MRQSFRACPFGRDNSGRLDLTGFPVQRRLALKWTEFLLFQTPWRIALVFRCRVVTPLALSAGQCDNFLWHRSTFDKTVPGTDQQCRGHIS